MAGFTKKPVGGGRLTKKEYNFIVGLIKAGKTKEQCIQALVRTHKRTISLEKLRQIAKENKTSFMKNTGHLNAAEKAFIDKSLKMGKSQQAIIKLFFERFKKTVSVSPIRNRATAIGHLFDRKADGEYSDEEILTLRSAILLGQTITQVAKLMKKRSISGIQSKFSSMKSSGALGENVKEAIKKEMKKGAKDRALAKKYQLSEASVREFRGKLATSASVVEHEDLKRWEASDIDKVMDQISATQESLLRLDSEQSEANINIKTKNKHVALMFLSDIHLENVNTDLDALRQDIDIIRATPDFYVGFGGDLIDNFIVGPHKEGVIEAVIPPKAARIVAGKLFDRLRGRMLWTIIGCHDAWDRDYADYNLPEHIARKLKIPYLGHGGDINISLKNAKKGSKDVLYQIHARHKYRGSGGDNGTGCCKNVLRNIDPKFDIVAISHNHFAEIKIENFLRKNRVFVRTGSYKKEDRYSRMLGFEKNEHDSKIPVVILNTETHEMRVVSGVRTASDTLKALNRK